MDDVIKLKGQYYILANSSLADEQSRVLKHADTFGVFDRRGNIRPLGFEDHGIYYQGTRFLSRSDIKLQGKAPLLLSSNVKEDNDFLVVDLTNPDFEDERGSFISRGTIHVVRTIFLWDGRYFERMKISNFGDETVKLSLDMEFSADFMDIFEVRGIKRKRSGKLLPVECGKSSITFSYKGLDNIQRKTFIEFNPAPLTVRTDSTQFSLSFKPKEEMVIEITCTCFIEKEKLDKISLEDALKSNKRVYENYHKEGCLIETSNEQFNDWINQSRVDLHLLLTQTPYGLYPFAGIPWFSTIFGRDGIITAMETMWIWPDIAKGVLGYLAATQATKQIEDQDAEPGKILHETRKGEMAALHEIPFGQYYGTIDATPLFVVLAGQYYERTGDLKFIKKIWSNIKAALNWIDAYGDVDKDGFFEYQMHASKGLKNQGWKDSEDSIFNSRGEFASSPVALCEVQAYVYDAKIRASGLASLFGEKQKAETLRCQAEVLKEKFIKAFWCSDLNSYAVALDGKKKPCKVLASNAGHCLFSGIADENHASKLIKKLANSSFSSGWGIRTLAKGEVRFNPMSYHNGSVWPHDNAIIAYGMARYGFKEEALKVMQGLFDASIFLYLHRLPELFCGFERRKGEGPTLYPVACDPQAWAAGAVFTFNIHAHIIVMSVERDINGGCSDRQIFDMNLLKVCG